MREKIKVYLRYNGHKNPKEVSKGRTQSYEDGAIVSQSGE